MGERGNVVGGIYALTTFAPVIGGREDALQAGPDALALGPQSPLARLPTLHESRLHVIRQPVYQGPPARRDTLRSAVLVFTASFDGPLDPFLDALAERVPEADGWWRHCAGYPGRADPAAFRAYLRAHQLDCSLFASPFPHARVGDIQAALAARERVAAFAVRAQGLGAAELQARFRAELAG